MIKKLREDFQTRFKEEQCELYFSPGRVNLIGEHTDYNGGMVFPCAITYGTYAAVGKRKDSILQFYSNNFANQGIVRIDLKDVHYDVKDDWTNYAKGVVHFIQASGCILPHGLDILIEGNIPNGAGLSSSASLEVLIGTILNETFSLNLSMIDIVKLSQKCENEFVGVNCGIMDQFVIGMGKKDCAIALDTATLEYHYVPIQLDNARIVIMNTNKQRGLADSKYNERRSECEEALHDLQKVISIQSLCELSEEKFLILKSAINRPVCIKRAQHAISEQARVIQAMDALNKKDLPLFGQLMNASHQSLANDYEVTGVELDTLVHSAWKCKGCIGARMTGAGFGGCTIAIVENEYIPSFQKQVEEEYTKIIGYAPSFYIASIGDGAKKL